ncbi:pilus assembly protein CpaA [Brevibacillus choshinensis]|uniref:Pilus assembly protein CpaA n=1 Tax=Brevibacillus choshinensis TaxID=54911 RepID=A0ABR5N8U6_BRECH|nr:A24 family peptidase [Brevibacillus choshinensis]KQL47041.1 pilus assembly protein CpaA [Brevibacillus choshinensis]
MNDVALLGLLTVAAYFDWRRRKVPNALTLPVMAVGLWYQWQVGTGWIAWGGLAGAFILTLGPVACKGMGMGDQKLLMAVGAWSSWAEVYSLFLYAILLCLLMIIIFPRTWSRLRENLQKIVVGWSAHRQLWLPGPNQTAFSLPFAFFLLGAFCIQQFPSVIGLHV